MTFKLDNEDDWAGTIGKRVKLFRTRGTDGGKDPESGDRRFHTDGFGLELAL
jgi:hypothetical protein